MKTVSRIAAAIAMLICIPPGALLAQSTPTTGPDTTASPPPAAAPDPAASPASTEPAKASTEPEKPATEPQKTAKTSAPKKKKMARTSRRHEVESSIESGTVPSRYRSSVPKEYQHYIPWSK